MYHPVVEKIITLLKENNVWYETFEHEEVRTSEEASKIRAGYTFHQGTKAMIVRVTKSASDKQFMMLVFPADMKFSSKKVKEVLDIKDIRFATQEEVSEITNGILPGGVPPFGNIFNINVIADPTVFENEKIVFNAGDRRFSVGMKSVDFKTIVNPFLMCIIQE